MDQIIKKIKQEIFENNGTILLHGEWGIGKTYLVKEVIEKFEEEKDKGEIFSFYLDARLFDQDKNMFEFFANWLYDLKDFKGSLKELKRKAKVMIENFSKKFLNKYFSTASDLKNISKDDRNIEIQADEISKNLKIYFFIDEIDRVTPDTILRILNFINGLIIIDDKFKVIAVANKEELNAILRRSFGYLENSSFIHKYFNKEISIDKIKLAAIKAIANKAEILSKNFSYLSDWIEILYQNQDLNPKIEARSFERILNTFAIIFSKYKNYFSEAVFAISLLSYLHASKEKIKQNNLVVSFQENTIHFGSIIFESKSYILRFNFAKDQVPKDRHYYSFFNDNMQYKISTSSDFSVHSDSLESKAIVELLTDYGIEKFEDWILFCRFPIKIAE